MALRAARRRCSRAKAWPSTVSAPASFVTPSTAPASTAPCSQRRACSSLTPSSRRPLSAAIAAQMPYAAQLDVAPTACAPPSRGANRARETTT
eukprot:scaffold94_cov340-Prasinococcus_capsulatus_cf.AAC.23